MAAALNTERVELADEPGYGDVTWVSSYDVDPFDVPVAEKLALLAEWSARLLASPRIDHVDAALLQVQENKFYADRATTATQQRVRLHPALTAVAVEPSGRFETMRTLAPPVGRGWEYLTGTGWDWDAELAALPEQLAAKLAAPSVDAGRYDLVIDPSNLWLTIHESIGHATELDRALGYEATYAGTSFATFDQLGSLQYGSPVMHVTGDRTVPTRPGHRRLRRRGRGRAVLGPGPRRHARRLPARPADGRADQVRPVQRLRVRRLPRPRADPADGQRLAAAGGDGPTTEELIAGVDDGIYVVGDKSWSIDMQRYNFQFTGQRFYRIRTGGWPASSATSPTRRRRPTSGARWRRSAARRPTCSAARSTAARASPARSRRSATAARRCCSAACGSSTRRRRGQ